MKTIRIYQPQQFETGQTIVLDKSASNHLIRVLRLKDKQTFTLFNGKGGEFLASLQITGKKATVYIQSFTETDNESPLKIHLLQGISKGERMDFVVQKSTELGVSQITPVICQRTVVNLKGERLQKKRQHWQKIAISACEQSGRNLLPEISSVCKLSSLATSSTNELKLFLDPLANININSLQPETTQLTILIGPEGGLTEPEMEQARQLGFKGIKLGPRILRTETAALSSIAMAQLLWGDMG